MLHTPQSILISAPSERETTQEWADSLNSSLNRPGVAVHNPLNCQRGMDCTGVDVTRMSRAERKSMSYLPMRSLSGAEGLALAGVSSREWKRAPGGREPLTLALGTYPAYPSAVMVALWRHLGLLDSDTLTRSIRWYYISCQHLL